MDMERVTWGRQALGRLDQSPETAAQFGASEPWKLYAPKSSGNAKGVQRQHTAHYLCFLFYKHGPILPLLNNLLVLLTMARFDAFSSDHDSLFNYSKFSPSNGSLASLTMSDSTCVQKFRERSSRLFDIENEKNQLIQVSHRAPLVKPVLIVVPQDMLFRLDATEKLLEQVRLDHDRETHYNREQQLRENQLQDQLRKVQSLMVHNLRPTTRPRC
jgi:hypothetical protein